MWEGCAKGLGILLWTCCAYAAIALSASVTGSRALWPKMGHDSMNRGRTSSFGPATNNVAWKFQTGGAVQSSPVVGSDGTVYVGASDNYFYAISPGGVKL